MRRSDQRRAAVWALYQSDLLGRPLDELFAPDTHAFTRALAHAVNNRLVLPLGLLELLEQRAEIPADLRPKLLEISHDYARKIAVEVRKMDEDALKQMKAQGLEVVPPKDPKTFEKAAASTWSVIRGKVVPAETFDEVKKLVDEFHAKHAQR